MNNRVAGAVAAGVLCGGLLLLTGCARSASGNSTGAEPRVVSTTAAVTPTAVSTGTPRAAGRSGLQVYREQYCGACHALAAAGATGAFCPSHDHMGSIAGQRLQDADYHGNAHTAAEYIRESIVNPKAYIVDGYHASNMAMPAYNNLSEQELEALVQLLVDQH